MKQVINGKLNPKLGLNIEGDLDLEGTNITELPDNLTVGGYLYLEGTKITELPDNLIVGGGLHLEWTNIKGVVYDCGKYNRAIYLDLVDKSLIRIGCFKGTKNEAIEAVKQKYSGDEQIEYINKIEECFGWNK